VNPADQTFAEEILRGAPREATRFNSGNGRERSAR
jgi:hypothetical protein